MKIKSHCRPSRQRYPRARPHARNRFSHTSGWRAGCTRRCRINFPSNRCVSILISQSIHFFSLPKSHPMGFGGAGRGWIYVSYHPAPNSFILLPQIAIQFGGGGRGSSNSSSYKLILPEPKTSQALMTNAFNIFLALLSNDFTPGRKLLRPCTV